MKNKLITLYCSLCSKPYLRRENSPSYNMKCTKCAKRTRSYNGRVKGLSPDAYADSILKTIPKEKRDLI